MKQRILTAVFGITFFIAVSPPNLAANVTAAKATKTAKDSQAPKGTKGAGSAEAKAEIVRATLFAPGGSFKQVLFKYEKQISKADGKQKTHVRYWDANGKLALDETSVYDKTGALETYRRMQHQIDEETRMERKGDRIEFYCREKKEEKRESERWTDQHKATDQLTAFIRENWDKLIAGKELEFRMLVPSRLDSVGFTIAKSERELTVKGQPTQAFAMEGANMIVRSMIDPVYFHFAKDGSKRLLLIDGRMPVKDVRGDDYNDVVGQLLFE